MVNNRQERKLNLSEDINVYQQETNRIWHKEKEAYPPQNLLSLRVRLEAAIWQMASHQIPLHRRYH
jgi:hypothetical protein